MAQLVQNEHTTPTRMLRIMLIYSTTGEGGGTQYRYFLFVFFSPYLAYECEHWLMGGSGVDDVQGHPRADLQVFRQPPS